MLRLDFFNKEYSLNEVANALSDNDLNNFKNDEDFLDFLICYSVGDFLEGEDPNLQNMEYSSRDGFLNIMLLDSYDYFGSKLYKIYEICGKDKLRFIRVCELIGRYMVRSSFDKKTLDTNLSLKESVDFIDDSIVLMNGKKPKYTFDGKKGFLRDYDISYDERQEYEYELERSLRHRINMSIERNGDNVEPLEEMISYEDKLRKEKEELESKRVDDSYQVDINNLFYGSEILDISGGVLNMNMKVVSWFEYTNVDMMGYHVFRSIPAGDYCLLDNNGKLYIPNEIIKKSNMEVSPTSPVRAVNIVNVPTILKDAIKKMEEESVDVKEEYQSLLSLIEEKETFSVLELDEYTPTIRKLFEYNYGPIFNSDNEKTNNSYEEDDMRL